MATIHDSDMLFQQLFEKECSAYTYLIADKQTREGVIIDPVIETSERDLTLINELNIKLKYILETHIHADHITGAGVLAKKTGAQIAMNAYSLATYDLPLYPNQLIQCNNLQIKVIFTPGHTNNCLSFYLRNAVFTGDALLIRANGRTDFQEGNPLELYASITKKLYTLPEDTLVFPAHEYAGRSFSTIALEKKFNKRLTQFTSEEEFIHTMNALKLPLPKKIDLALPANLQCGRLGVDKYKEAFPILT